jgi:hypothetical protein
MKALVVFFMSLSSPVLGRYFALPWMVPLGVALGVVGLRGAAAVPLVPPHPAQSSAKSAVIAIAAVIELFIVTPCRSPGVELL